MKVAVVAPSPVPYAPGGAESLWRGLHDAIAGGTAHHVELLKLPTREHSLPELMASYETFSRLDLSHFDVVISGKYPAWMVAHPRHVVWMLHPLRGLYDAYESFGLPVRVDGEDPLVRRLAHQARSLRHRDDLPGLFSAWRDTLLALGPEHPDLALPGPMARALVHALDRFALSPQHVTRHLAISRTVAERPSYFPAGAQVEVVHPPTDLVGLHPGGASYFFTVSRLDGPKRLSLLIEAMRHYRGALPLRIAGTGPELAALEALAADDPRIELLGYVPRSQVVALYADALAVPFVPYDEDFGLVTLEAMAAGKAVITCTDSGGPTEVVIPDVTGLVVPPTAEAIGAALTSLDADHVNAAALGEAGARLAHATTWQNVVSTLLGDGSSPVARAATAVPPRRRGGRPRLVAVSTFPLSPTQGGGQVRCVHLYGGLTEHFDVDVICLGAVAAPRQTHALRPGLVEHLVPKSRAHEAAEAAEMGKVGIPVTDIVAGRLVQLTPDFGRALADAIAGAAAVVLAHPFLHPAVVRVAPDVPVIYDAHNCEIDLKDAMLPPGRDGDRQRDRVREVEGAAVRAAQLIATVSAEDAAALQRSYGTPSAQFVDVPNGVDPSAVHFVEGADRRRNRDRYLDRLQWVGTARGLERIVVFLGSWHPPNIDAARHLLAVAEQVPSVLFALVGGHSSALQGLAVPPNVFLMGAVSDSTKRLLLRSADVGLNPVVAGSGTNLKMLEYAAAGVPVISTPTGARGLAFDPSAIVLAEQSDFAAAILEVLSDDEPADVRARRARATVEATYDWSLISRRLLAALRETLSC